MKKMIITAFAVTIAAVSQAASINWEVNNQAWKMQDGTYAAAGTSMWLINKENSATIIAALKNSAVVNFAGDWETTISGLTGVYGTAFSGTEGMLSETLITNDALVDIQVKEVYYDLATLIIDNESSSDTIYYNISDGTGESYATTDSTAYDTATFSKTKFANGTGWQIAQQVPEPTSGLLMLIGMAGLALRRRRA